MNCQNPNSCRITRRCPNYAGVVLCFLAFVFAFAVGLILGAIFFETILPVVAAVIAFAAAILVVIIALLIYWRINRNCNN